MESKEDFQALSGALNEEVIKLRKEKRIMKTLLIATSRTSISTADTYEKLNFATSFVCVLYFMTRTITYSAMPFLFWTGLISVFLWIAQLFYSWIGYRKLKGLDLGQDSVKNSIDKISSLLKHYTLQKNIYLWLAPLTIFTAFPIPLFEFRGIEIFQIANNYAIAYTIIVLLLATLLVIWLSKKMWEDKFNAPLENAKNNLKELEE